MLLVETTYNTQAQIVESAGKKCWFIEGICLQSDIVNQNKRLYPRGIMEAAVKSFSSDFLAHNRAVGELNHPQTPEVNPERIAIRIENLNQDGANFLTKARVLGTPTGQIVSSLLEGGVKLGLSSRGMGALKANSQGINEVQQGYKIAAIDVVYYPSAPDAFVQGIMEGKNVTWNTSDEDVQFVENLKNDLTRAKMAQLQEAKMKMLESFIKRFGGIKVR